MSLFLITGLPGTGKSTICEELKTQGYEAYDGDYDHLAKWYNNITGEPVQEGKDHERTPEFLQNHSRNISRQRVEDLASQAQSKIIFLCADPENEDELIDLFEKVFALVVDEDVRQERLATRTNNKWGKLPHEIAYDLAIKPIAYSRYKKDRYHILDASQTPRLITNRMIAQIKEQI